MFFVLVIFLLVNGVLDNQTCWLNSKSGKLLSSDAQFNAKCKELGY